MSKKTIYNDYETAIRWIGKGRSGFDRPVANNTRLVLGEGVVGLRLHQTNVVNLYQNGDVEFDSGGWRTVTTADRMRFHGDFVIFTEGGIWYIYHRPSYEAAERRLRKKFGVPTTWEPAGSHWESNSLGHVGLRSAGYGFWLEVAEVIGRKDAVRMEREFNRQLKAKVHLFFDGIKFTARGKCLNGLTVEQTEIKVSSSNRLRQRIRAYAKAAAHFLHDGIVTEEVSEPWFEITEFDYHYCERVMDERQYPIRLYYDAMEEAGYNPIGIAMHLGERLDEELGVHMIGGTRPGYQGQRREAANLDNVANAIYKFIGKRMLPDREVRNAFGGMSPSAMEGIK